MNPHQACANDREFVRDVEAGCSSLTGSFSIFRGENPFAVS